jgi:hypothetical protein
MVRAKNELSKTVGNEPLGVMGFRTRLAGLALLSCAVSVGVGCGRATDEPECQGAGLPSA